MPAVNPRILVWARETAGLTLQEAVARVGIGDARGVAAVDRLAALERGENEPTRPVLVRMARHYRRPLLAFYLSAPPRRADRGVDFRTLTGPRSTETDALIDALVRNVRSRQHMVRAALEAEDEAEPLPFVGALSKPRGPATATEPPGSDRHQRRTRESSMCACCTWWPRPASGGSRRRFAPGSPPAPRASMPASGPRFVRRLRRSPRFTFPARTWRSTTADARGARWINVSRTIVTGH